MSDSQYTPPKVWKWDSENGGKFANINRPISGSTHEKELPVGKHPIQLYSLGTPNGIKVTVMLEELLALGHDGAKVVLEGQKVITRKLKNYDFKYPLLEKAIYASTKN